MRSNNQFRQKYEPNPRIMATTSPTRFKRRKRDPSRSLNLS
jgi:hypothetical protein